MMLPVLGVLQHSQISHHGPGAATSTIDRVLLLPEMSSGLLAAKVPSGSLLGGKHGTIPVFLPTLNPVHQK